MAGADLGTLTAKLQLNTSGAEQAVKKLGGMFGPLGDAIAAIATTLIVVGAVSVDLAAKFQSSTDLMAAQAGISAKAASKIGDAFLSTGGKSTFSAQTIMAAFGPVSGVIATAAGHALSASEAMTFMSAAMNLAEATGQPLADTTSALAKVMLQYGINVGQAAGTSDLLFNVSRKLGIPIATLGDAVDKLKYKLGPLAPTLQDVGSLLLDLGEHHGPTGSRGLLLVSTAFNTLLGNSKATNAEIAKTGLHVFTASGAFVGMQSIIAQLAPKLAGMTEAHRLLAEKELFGSGASKALDATILAGLPGFDAAKTAADKLGTAHQGAQTATDNLKGAFDRVKSAVTDWLTMMGQKLLPIITTVANWIASNFAPAMTTLGNIITNNVIPAVMGVWGWLANHLGPIVTQLAGWIANKLLPQLTGLWQSFTQHVLPAITPVVTALGKGAAGLLGVIVPVGEFIANVLLGALKVMADHFNVLVVPLGIAVTAFGLWKGYIIGGEIVTFLQFLMSPGLRVGLALFAVQSWAAAAPWIALASALAIVAADIAIFAKAKYFPNAIPVGTSGGPIIGGRANTPGMIPGKGGAQGGPVIPGLRYRVGETGEEDFISGIPGRLIPHDQIGGRSITIIQHITNPGASAEDIANRVSWALKTAAV